MHKFHEIDNSIIAEVTDETFVISDIEDTLDLMGDLAAVNCSMIILYEKNLHPDFFRLKTGLAGEILQKFSNYNFKLAIVGNLSKYMSKRFQEFIYESNRGNRIFFCDNLDSALVKLMGK
jgi:hypothetical protein